MASLLHCCQPQVTGLASTQSPHRGTTAPPSAQPRYTRGCHGSWGPATVLIRAKDPLFSAVRVGPVWSCPQADQLSQQTPESTVLVPSRRCSSLRWPLQWSWPDNNNITSPHPDICTGLLLTAHHCTAWHLRHGNDSKAALLHSSLSFASVCMNDVRIAKGGAGPRRINVKCTHSSSSARILSQSGASDTALTQALV